MIVGWVLLKIINEQHSRVLEILKNSNTCSRVLEKVFELKTYYLKNFLMNNRPRRHCKTRIILFPRTNLKRIKLIKTFFRKFEK